jgi:transcriptional regulator with XRE-family HTH domain
MKINIDCGVEKYVIKIDDGAVSFKNGDLFLKSDSVTINRSVFEPTKILVVPDAVKTKGQQLRELRVQYGLTQKELAKKLSPNPSRFSNGLTDKDISNYETGRKDVPFWLLPHAKELLEAEKEQWELRSDADGLRHSRRVLSKAEIGKALETSKKR